MVYMVLMIFNTVTESMLLANYMQTCKLRKMPKLQSIILAELCTCSIFLIC